MYKDFEQRQREIRESFDPLLSINEVRRIIGASAATVVDLIRDGKLEAFHMNGTAIDRRSLDYETRGLRITPSSLQEHLESIRVR